MFCPSHTPRRERGVRECERGHFWLLWEFLLIDGKHRITDGKKWCLNPDSTADTARMLLAGGRDAMHQIGSHYCRRT
uniref:Uncharacterized protein n=1 Tax=Picea glauca TaxID=3330 RepID=A0A101LX08_PICGL|nr:hypothetical protein ABT39_MTgene6332 [Picea glauca]QHR87035.1 hypothetical protein Q903MT_gene1044 [Picea sitchensis]